MNLSARLLGSLIEIYQRIRPIWVKFDVKKCIISINHQLQISLHVGTLSSWQKKRIFSEAILRFRWKGAARMLDHRGCCIAAGLDWLGSFFPLVSIQQFMWNLWENVTTSVARLASPPPPKKRWNWHNFLLPQSARNSKHYLEEGCIDPWNVTCSCFLDQ